MYKDLKDKRIKLRQIEFMAKRRIERLTITNKIKTAGGCIDCGYNIHPAALQFHHRIPSEKLFGISKSYSRSWKAVETEISKCDIICANCHFIRHYKDIAELDGIGRHD